MRGCLLILLGMLLWVGCAQEPVPNALARAERLIQQAQRVQGVKRQRLLEQARKSLSALPAEVRAPIEQHLNRARLGGGQGAMRSALREIESYRATFSGDSPALNPDQVRTQLQRIFAEPDMQPPPKPLYERISEAVGRVLSGFFRWLSRVLGGLGGAGTGGWGVIVQWVIIAILVLLIAFGASYLLGRLEWRRVRRAPTPLSPEELLDARLLASAEWRALAQQLLAQGEMRLAARALYLGLLRLLHEARLLDYDPARTNWEHLMHLRSPALPDPSTREQAYRLLQPLTLRFDYLWYGSDTTTEQDVRQFEAAFETLSRTVRHDAQRVA
jgi:hypothetical protein